MLPRLLRRAGGALAPSVCSGSRRGMARCLEQVPVAVPKELLMGFQRAEGIVAPFGDGISIADHCLQMATDLHNADWVPDLYRRDMVVMAIFHDIYFTDSQAGHGEMVASQLEGRLHPHVLAMLKNHTDLNCPAAAKASHDKFAISTRRMLDPFREFDCHTTHGQRDWLSLDFFRSEGYFREDKDLGHSSSSKPSDRAPWLSPNGTLVWAAPSVWIERTPLLLAKKLGLFQAAGLPPVELSITDGGPELLKQVREGRVHLAEIGMFPFLAAADGAEPPPGRLIGSTFIQQLDHYLAAGDASITSIKHLEGRRVGVLSRGSCDSYLLRAMLANAGADASLVEEVPLGALYGSTDILRDGTVDAAFLVEPALSHAEDLGVAQVLKKASCLYPRFQWGGLLASDHFRQDAPDVLLRVMEVYKDACQLMHRAVTSGEPSEALSALGELGKDWFGVSEATFLRALRRDATTWQLDWESVDFEGAQACLDIQRELGVFKGEGPRMRDIFALDVRGLAEEFGERAVKANGSQ